jgi:hypothetical protein
MRQILILKDNELIKIHELIDEINSIRYIFNFYFFPDIDSFQFIDHDGVILIIEILFVNLFALKFMYNYIYIPG